MKAVSIKSLPLFANSPSHRKREKELVAAERAQWEAVHEQARRRYEESQQSPEQVAARAEREEREAFFREERCPTCGQRIHTRKDRYFKKWIDNPDRTDAEIYAEIDKEDEPISRRVIRTDDKEVNKK